MIKRGVPILLIVFATLFALGDFSPAMATKRAVVIGFSNYQWSQLPGVRADLSLVRPLLAKDYKVTVINDLALTRQKFYEQWYAFKKTIEQGDEVLIYYSGHGMEVEGVNYLVPLDAPDPKKNSDLEVLAHQLVKLRELIQDVQETNPAITILMINACRDNPYSDARGGKSRGMVPEVVDRYGGYTLVFYAADFGQEALDRVPERGDEFGSPFARAFVDLFDIGSTLPTMIYFQLISNAVQVMVLPRDQLPTLQGMIPPEWCISKCRLDAVTLIYNSDLNTGSNAAKRELVSASIEPRDNQVSGHLSMRDDRRTTEIGNVVFLGKTSVANCEGDSATSDMPFGCAFLREAISVTISDGKVRPDSVKLARVRVPVNVRKTPVKVRDAKGYYGCRVRVLNKGETVKLKAITAVQYAKDTFLWGVVDADQITNCL